MAIICSVKAIEPLIPKRNEQVFMSMMTHTSEKALQTCTVYGIEIDTKKDKVDKVYKVAFSLFSAPGSSYLFIRDATSELTTATPYIKLITKEGEEYDKGVWDFKSDEIGLYVSCGQFDLKRIYFVTSILDKKEIDAYLNKRSERKTVVLETVYV